MLKSVVSAALRHMPFTQRRGKFSFCTKKARPSRPASQAGKLAALWTIKESKAEAGVLGMFSFELFVGFSSEPHPVANKAAKPIVVKLNFVIFLLLC
jgi:hypothetical protein